MQDKLSIARQQAGSTPLYITEFNSGLYCCLHDTPFASAFLISQLPKLAKEVDILSYWTFSDIFEEWPFKSAPFQSGFGLQTIYGVPKPAFRAYELLHRAGEFRHQLGSNSRFAPTVDVFAVSNKTHIMVFVSNWNTPGNAIAVEEVTIDLTAITGTQLGTIERIDDAHANPQQTWINQGSPMYPTKQQIADMMDASMLIPEGASVNGNQFFTFSVPPQGVAVLTVTI